MAKKKKFLKGYLFAKDGFETGMVEVQKSLESYYKVLNCKTIDVVHAKVGVEYYDIVCDDDGLMKTDYVITAINPKGASYLAGNILIFKHDGNGDFESLDLEDEENIIDNMVHKKVDLDPEDTKYLADKMLVFEYAGRS